MGVLRPRPVVAVVVALTVSWGSLARTSSVAAADPTVEHCTLSVTGRNDDGSFTTSPLHCERVSPHEAHRERALLGTIAVHYDGYNFTGSALSISGWSCAGWLNLPAAWQDRVVSSISVCTVRHYRDINRQGTVELTLYPGGNLSTLAGQVSSVAYN